MSLLPKVALFFDAAVQRSFQSPTISCMILLFCVAFYRLSTRRFLHLRKIPGPWWAPYTRLWLFKTLASEDSPNRYIQVNEQYGMSDFRQIFSHRLKTVLSQFHFAAWKLIDHV